MPVLGHGAVWTEQSADLVEQLGGDRAKAPAVGGVLVVNVRHSERATMKLRIKKIEKPFFDKEFGLYALLYSGE